MEFEEGPFQLPNRYACNSKTYTDKLSLFTQNNSVCPTAVLWRRCEEGAGGLEGCEMKGHDGISFSFENSVANGSALTYCPDPDLRPLSQILFSFSFTLCLFICLCLCLCLQPSLGFNAVPIPPYTTCFTCALWNSTTDEQGISKSGMGLLPTKWPRWDWDLVEFGCNIGVE